MRFTLLVLMTAMAAAGGALAQESTWEAPPIATQLDMDPTVVPVGKGAVYCPYMTDPENEPSYGILINGEIRENSRMGRRVVLAPGVYDVVYGSGTADQMMQKRVRVVEGATTLIKPDWAGLVIEVINSTRTNIREYYELFNLESGNSYGIGQGVEEGLDERIRTWILPPGLYKVVKPGDNVNTVINFGTVRLLPGELTRVSLVLDEQTGDFMGFGHVADVRQLARQRLRKWKVRSELSGNALLNYISKNVAGEEQDLSFTATGQLLTDGRYESGRHVIPVWGIFEEGLSMTGNRDIHKYIDRAELKLTYIYRLSNMLSPYVRVAAETRLFQTHHYFNDPTDYMVLDDSGDTLRVVRGANDLNLGSPFSPIQLKQGFGITSSLVQTVPLNINLRTGYGARQTFARGASIFNTNTNTLAPMVETDLTGMELLLLGDIRFYRYFILNTEFDILMPKTDSGTWVFDSENRLRFNITSNVSILFIMEFWQDENISGTQRRYQTLLRFSKFM